MIFYENRLLADNSHEISSLGQYFFQKLGKMSQNLSSSAVVIIGALIVKIGKMGEKSQSRMQFS